MRGFFACCSEYQNTSRSESSFAVAIDVPRTGSLWDLELFATLVSADDQESGTLFMSDTRVDENPFDSPRQVEAIGPVGGNSFVGSTVLICGRATGIGAAAARGFARAGATTVVADIAEGDGDALVATLVTEGRSAGFRHCDVSSERDVVSTFAAVEEQFGAINTVFANAGIEWTKDVRHTTLTEWQRVIDVNLTGMFLVGRESLRLLYARGHGSVILTSSPHATATVADTVAYAASKGGVNSLVRALSLEAAAFAVRVNGVVPGTIDTPMVRRELQASSDPELQLSLLASGQPLQRVGQPEDVANLVMYLPSPMASFITGALVSVDGGLMAGLPAGKPPSYQD